MKNIIGIIFISLCLSAYSVGDLISDSHLNQEFEQSTKLIMSLLEPLVVVVMGGIVALIVVAILLPMMQMNNISLIN